MKKPKNIQENIILDSLKESVDVIKKKRGYFGILFITQLAFIIALFFILGAFVAYSTQMMEQAQTFFEDLGDVPADMDPIGTASLLENADEISVVYNSMMDFRNRMVLLGFIAFGIYLLLGGLNWDLANLMVNEKSSFILYEVMFFISTAVFTITAFLFTGFFISLLNYIGTGPLARLIFMIVLTMIFYFAFISFGLINKYDTKQKTQFLKHTIRLGYKKFGTLLFSFFFMLLIISIFAGVIYYSLTDPIWIFPIAGIFLFILALAWGKIYFLITVKKVNEKI
ncbi:hypothetical protein GOV06_02455 [Candidatus Woesearchaeota archaeon]|nr:hypothetical protein [Candidatus Woesearchaeota archaeon]